MEPLLIDTVEVDDELQAVAGHLNVQMARMVATVARALAEASWYGPGLHSAAHWVAWKMGLGVGTAKRVVAVAEQRDAFPVLMAAFDRGELSFDQIATIVLRAPSWADAMLLDFARVASVAQLRKAIRPASFDDDPDQPVTEAKVAATRDRLSTWIDDDGRWRITGDLDPATGARIDAALAERRDALFTGGDTDVTLAEALVDVCERSVDAVESPSRRDSYRTWLHLDADGNASTTQGWRIPDAVRRQILCDGVIQPVWSKDGVPFNLGRSQHIVSDRLRRIIVLRDHGCGVPGCTSDAHIEVHHIVHWEDGGVTDTWNLISLGPRHHRMHHRGLLGIEGNADQPGGLRFSDRWGRSLDANPPPRLPTAPPPPPPARYEHPIGGRVDYAWVGLSWTHPAAKAKRQAARPAA
jgi:hypothetical protein